MSSPIDVKTAVRNAIAYLQQFQEFITARAVRLEETEYDDKGYWLITLSSIDDPDVSDTLYKLTGSSRDHKREYKISASTQRPVRSSQ